MPSKFFNVVLKFFLGWLIYCVVIPCISFLLYNLRHWVFKKVLQFTYNPKNYSNLLTDLDVSRKISIQNIQKNLVLCQNLTETTVYPWALTRTGRDILIFIELQFILHNTRSRWMMIFVINCWYPKAYSNKQDCTAKTIFNWINANQI